MKKVFISYSHKDANWLQRLLVHLRPMEKAELIDLWSDTRIKPGARWVEEIKTALAGADIAVLLVSADFLASEFISSQELPTLLRQAEKNNCLIMPVILRPCLFSEMQDLQQFQAVNSPRQPLSTLRKPQAEEWLVKAARSILDAVSSPKPTQARSTALSTITTSSGFKRDPRIDSLISGIKLADWDSATQAAIKIIEQTDSEGNNELFEAILQYRDCPDDDDILWPAMHTLESCVSLAPWLITHKKLSALAEHKNFSVRSSAASICMDLAHSAPHRVPLDLLIRLSRYDEDWYVERPANAALKAMAKDFPGVLHVFYQRLRSEIAQEREHAALAIADVAKIEPFLINQKVLAKALVHLRKIEDDDAAKIVNQAFVRCKKSRVKSRYRYGL